MIFAGAKAFTQNNSKKNTAGKTPFQVSKLNSTYFSSMSFIKKETVLPAVFPPVKNTVPFEFPSQRMTVISGNFYAQNLGFFCKKEWQWEKITKIPFKFRLGSVQQCDLLEGKPYPGIRQ